MVASPRPTPAPAPRPEALRKILPGRGWRESITRSGYFLGALLLHLVLFLLIAAWVIFPAKPSPTGIFQPTSIPVATTPPVTPLPPHAMTMEIQPLAPLQTIRINRPEALSLFQPPLTPPTASTPIPTSVITPANPDAGTLAGRIAGIRKMEAAKWNRPQDNVGATGGDPKNAEATFPVYLASYADGDWNCNVQMKGDVIQAGSLPNLVAKIREWSRGKLKAELAPKPLDIASPDLLEKMPLFIFFAGHKDFVLKPEEVANLGAYLSRGGCIWGDNSLAGRGSRFDLAFRREMKRVVPDKGKQFEPLSLESDLFTKDRWFNIKSLPEGMNYFAEPIEHLDIDGKVAILYTPNDYSDLFAMRILPGDQAIAGSTPVGDSPLVTNELFAFDAPAFFRNYSLQSCLAAQHLGMNIVGYLLVRFDDRLLLAP